MTAPPTAPASGPTGALPRPRALRFGWIGVFYLGSGLPFGIFKELFPVWLRAAGVAVDTIGWLGGLASAWSLKVLWSPLVDRIGGRRPWIAGSLVGCAAALTAVAFAGPHVSPLFIFVVGAFVVASATQDVAVDAWTIGIVEKDEEGPANSVRVVAYRIAMWVAGGLAVALAAWLPWRTVMVLLALLMLGLAVAALFAPGLPRPPSRTLRSLFAGLVAWLREPGALPLAAVVLLYKMPDAALGMMVRTFWVDAGLTVEFIGLWVSPLTLFATIGGAAIGGLLVARIGILHGLLWLGLAQMLSNVAYSLADWSGRAREIVVAAAGIESFCSGLGTAALLALLMRVCEKERAATEYALLSALFAATRELTGAVSGEGVLAFGYGGWFALSMAFGVPALALLFSRSLAARAREPLPFSRRRRPSPGSGPGGEGGSG